MTRLSSRATPFLKWVMPAGWVLIVGGVGVMAWMATPRDPGALVVVCLLPVILGLVYRFQIWPLADEVVDGGDALRLRRCGQLGDEIAFLPSTRLHWNPFARDPLVEDLIRRVDEHRGGTGYLVLGRNLAKAAQPRVKHGATAKFGWEQTCSA